MYTYTHRRKDGETEGDEYFIDAVDKTVIIGLITKHSHYITNLVFSSQNFIRQLNCQHSHLLAKLLSGLVSCTDPICHYGYLSHTMRALSLNSNVEHFTVKPEIFTTFLFSQVKSKRSEKFYLFSYLTVTLKVCRAVMGVNIGCEKLFFRTANSSLIELTA